MFSTRAAEVIKTPTKEPSVYETKKEELLTELKALDSIIKKTSSMTISHNETILLLEKTYEAYENKFLPFHTAARKTHFESKEAESDFNDIKSRLEGQFEKVSKIWEKHKGERSIKESIKYRFSDNRTKELFKRSTNLLQKSSISSKVPEKSYSYHHSSSSSLLGSDIITPFLLGAILF
jgi:hypothetical protein